VSLAAISEPASPALLVRTWNLFHGNTSPRGSSRRLERMVRLAVEDAPGLVLLQELPVFALARLNMWTGYTSFGAVAARPRLPAELGGRVTDLRPALFRSALEGQANAILVAPALAASDHAQLALNPRRFRRREAERLQLPLGARAKWAWERRVVHAVRVAIPDGRTIVVANMHATNYRPDKRLADVELLRAAAFADALARPDEPVVLGGDFNVTIVSSPTLRALSTSEWGFSAAGPGVDHVLIRGLDLLEGERAWPPDRRRANGRLLSDHAPVEVRVR
jgi:endonuclease/exonuclease/phosphatase family metal-dependent hydrolase